MLNPETIKAASPVAQTIAKQLWPTMLFIVLMAIITGLFAYWWTDDSPINHMIAFWLWFVSALSAMGFAVWGFVKDVGIHNLQALAAIEKAKKPAKAPKAKASKKVEQSAST